VLFEQSIVKATGGSPFLLLRKGERARERGKEASRSRKEES
jgi:hypothetical protein